MPRFRDAVTVVDWPSELWEQRFVASLPVLIQVYTRTASLGLTAAARSAHWAVDCTAANECRAVQHWRTEYNTILRLGRPMRAYCSRIHNAV